MADGLRAGHRRGRHYRQRPAWCARYFGIPGVLFEQALVNVALHVGAERAPRLLVDEIDDEAAQMRGVLELVLGFPENDAEDARLLAEIFEGIALTTFERQAVQLNEAWPSCSPRGWWTSCCMEDGPARNPSSGTRDR
jgi:hypothetical protein